MALTQAQRIEISKKIVSIPAENSQADKLIVDLDAAKAKAQDKDNGNKDLMDNKTIFIDQYENEIERCDGNGRLHLTETHIQNGATKPLGNFFFNNNTTITTPSCPQGVWAFFTPNGYNVAIGKAYNETYTSVQKEQDLIDAINAQITTMEGYTGIGRSTGQECIPATPGYCTPPCVPNDEGTCTGGGGVWTPPTPEIIQNNPLIQATSTALKNAVQAWEDFVNATNAIICTTDTDPTRSAENTAAKNDITNAISVIDTWQALADFDTGHGQTTCAGFNGYNPNLLGPTKYRVAELAPLKAEITARQAFLTTRITQLQGYLGSITQDAEGKITAAVGMYGDRFRIINLRLNLMNGSLTEVKGYEMGKKAQEEGKSSNSNADIVYSAVMKATLFMAPAAGTATIHVMDASAFAPGNSVYVTAEDQAEISSSIINVNGNRVVLSSSIPKQYRQDSLARMYKIL